MRKYLLILFLLIGFFADAQAPNIIYGKKIILSTRDTSSAEFQILNSTRNVLGFLKNIGGGNTQFVMLGISDIASLSDSLLSLRILTNSKLAISNYDWSTLPNKPTNFPVVFGSNVTVNGPAGIRVGKYTNGQTIPAAGKTLDQFLTDIAIEAVAPTYYAPTASIGSAPASGLYERGTALSITLNSSYTQNDGGASSITTYRKNGTNLGSNTDNILSLTAQVGYDVQITYAQGACKNNNLGVQDCTGRITAGIATSGTIYLTPFDKRYWGFVNSATPTDAEIRALTQDGNGTTVSLSLTNITPSGSQYLVYVRPNSGSVSSITVNGFPSTAAFTTTTRSFTNAQGYASSYQIIISNNAQTSILNSVIYQ